jgi:TolB protein
VVEISCLVKRLALLIFLVGACTGALAAADRRIAFERDDAVYLANFEATMVRKLTDGIFPAISPDVTRVAFTTVERSGGNYIRRIAVTEIASGRTTVFSEIPSDNSYGAAWSPDGNWVAFTFRLGDLWHLGLIKADGTGFKLVKRGQQDQVTLYSPCWANDGQSIFCQDMTNLYRIGLDGSIMAQWNIGKIVPNGTMSGDGRIDVSPNGNRLLLSIDMDEDYTRKDWDGPVPALWSFDLTTQTAVRLSSKKLFAWDGCWLDDANILFLSQREGEKQAAVYRTNGKTLKRLIENARRPSVSSP